MSDGDGSVTAALRTLGVGLGWLALLHGVLDGLWFLGAGGREIFQGAQLALTLVTVGDVWS